MLLSAILLIILESLKIPKVKILVAVVLDI